MADLASELRRAMEAMVQQKIDSEAERPLLRTVRNAGYTLSSRD